MTITVCGFTYYSKPRNPRLLIVWIIELFKHNIFYFEFENSIFLEMYNNKWPLSYNLKNWFLKF